MQAIVTFGVLALLAMASPAAAGGGHDARAVVQHIFETADRNGDDKLTRSEYEGAGLQSYGVSFDESDTNADGETSLAEYLDHYDRHHPPVERRDA